MPELRITDVKAFPTSFPIPPANRVALGIGTAAKRDAVLVKVTTSGGVTGWGEAPHGRAPTTVGKLIDTTLKQLILNLEAPDLAGVWDRMYRFPVAGPGPGAGARPSVSRVDK